MSLRDDALKALRSAWDYTEGNPSAEFQLIEKALLCLPTEAEIETLRTVSNYMRHEWHVELMTAYVARLEGKT